MTSPPLGTCQLRRLTRLRYGDALPEAVREEGEIPVAASGGVVGWHGKANTSAPVIVVGRKGSYGAVHWSAVPVFVIDTAYAIDRYFRPTVPRWLYYVLSVAPLRSLSQDVGVPGLSRAQVHALPVPDVAVPHQVSIADFLDDETGRIEAMHRRLEDGRRLIHEQRSAVIEALTEAPSLPLKYTLVRIEQGWSPDCEATLAEAGAWGVLKAGAPNYARFRPDEHKALPSDVEPPIRLEVRPGDVLMSRANTRELAGSAAVVESTGGWRLMLCDKLYRLVAGTDRYRPHYLVAALASRRVRDQIEMATSGASASMQNITQEVVRALRVPCSSLETQADVESKLAIDWRRRKTLLTHLKTLEERLAEYRDALITEAVTGQLDVGRLSDSQLDESAHAAMEGERPEVLTA